MNIVPVVLGVFWWIAIWGLFDIYTENKTTDEKIKIYLVLLGILIVLLCFFPKWINHF